MVDLRVVMVSAAMAAACGGPGTSAPPARSPMAPAAERLPAVVVTGEVSLRATFSLTAAAAPDQSP